MRVRAIFILAVAVAMALGMAGCEQPPVSADSNDATAEIRAMLDAQIADWNRGDVDAFMHS